MNRGVDILVGSFVLNTTLPGHIPRNRYFTPRTHYAQSPIVLPNYLYTPHLSHPYFSASDFPAQFSGYQVAPVICLAFPWPLAPHKTRVISLLGYPLRRHLASSMRYHAEAVPIRRKVGSGDRNAVLV